MTTTTNATINDRMDTMTIEVPVGSDALDVALIYLETAIYEEYPVALQVEIEDGGQVNVITDSRESVRPGKGADYREFISLWQEQ